MKVESEKDFLELRSKITSWYKRFPMFKHDVKDIELRIEEHIKNHSINLVYYRQTHKKSFLENAQKDIDAINSIVAVAEKMELMSMLSRG